MRSYLALVVALAASCGLPITQQPPPQQPPPPPVGTRADTLGLFLGRGNYFALSANNVESERDLRFQIGDAVSAFLMPIGLHGDFDGQGGDTAGVFDMRTRTFFLKHDNSPGHADVVFSFSSGGSLMAPGLPLPVLLPLAGDWTGKGFDSVGVYDPGSATFQLRSSNTAGGADLTVQLGVPTSDLASISVPVTGDWTGAGHDSVGVYDPRTGTFALKSDLTAGPADLTFQFGPIDPANVAPVIGDWDGDGKDTVALFDKTRFVLYLRNQNTAGPADQTLQLETTSWQWQPMAGKWRATTAAPESPGYAWPQGAPASQSIDASKLDVAFAEAAALKFTRSLLVIRHGVLVREQYFNGNRPEIAHQIASVSKSVMSALFGIAQGSQPLTTLERPISQLLPAKYFPSTADPRLSQVTLAEVMSMSAGFDSGVDDIALESILPTDDWVGTITAMPFAHAPGATFNYFTGLNFLGSHILTDQVGKPLDVYAQEKLFGPLGIRALWWNVDPQGYAVGGCDIGLKPRDLARFGFLYLNEGLVDGQQIIPKSWIDASTLPIISVGDGRSYGLWWWHPIASGAGSDIYYALGHGGQYVYVVPSLDAVIVMTSSYDVQGAQEESQYTALAPVTAAVLEAFQ